MVKPLAAPAPIGAPMFGNFGLMTPEQLAMLKQQEQQQQLTQLMSQQRSPIGASGSAIGFDLGNMIQGAVDKHYGRVDPQEQAAQGNAAVLQLIQQASGGDPDVALQLAAKIGIPQAVQAYQLKQKADADLSNVNDQVTNRGVDNARADTAAKLAAATADRETKAATWTTIAETPSYIIQVNGLGQKKVERKETSSEASASPPPSKDDLDTYVGQIASYDQAMPTASARSLKSLGISLPTLTAMVKAKNPDWSATGFPGMLNATTKIPSRALQAQDAATRHLDLYNQASQAYDTGDLQALNHVAAQFGVQTGDNKVTVMRNIASIVGPEITKAIVPGGGGVNERKENSAKLDPTLSPAQRQGNVQAFYHIMSQQRASAYDSLASAAPGYSQEAFDKRFKVSPSFRAYMDAEASGAATPAAAPAAHKIKILSVTPIGSQ